jgi:hypothetical protein
MTAIFFLEVISRMLIRASFESEEALGLWRFVKTTTLAPLSIHSSIYFSRK